MVVGVARTDKNLSTSQAYYSTPQKEPALTDKAYEVGLQIFEYADEATGLVADAAGVAKEFTKIPKGLDEFLIALKSFKIVKGMLAIPELVKGVFKIVTAEKIKHKIFGGWSVAKAAKKIVGAVETIFYYLSKLNVISKASTAWTTITGYVFMPISIISTALSTYELGKKIQFMNSFRSDLKQLKHGSGRPQRNVAIKTVTHILSQDKSLRKMEVITKSCPLNERLKNIICRLKSTNEKTRAQAADEALLIKKRLKDRISEQVGMAAVGTAVSTAGVASTIIGLACPPAAPALAILGVVLTVVGIVNMAYSKMVPQGDIFDTEKRMLFSSIRKGVKCVVREIKAACTKLACQVQKIAQKITNGLAYKAALAA